MATRHDPLDRFESREWLLLEGLHAGPLQDPPWRDFVGQLRQYTGAQTASLSYRMDHLDGPGVRTLSIAPEVPNASDLHTGGIHPVFAPPGHQRMPTGRFFDVCQYLDYGRRSHRAFRDLVQTRHGLKSTRLACVGDGMGGMAWLSVSWACVDISQTVLRLLDALLPHVGISLRNFAALDRQRSHTLASQEAVRRLNLCWLKMNAQGRILDKDAMADGVLNASSAFRRPPVDRLVLSDPVADREMRGAIAALATKPNGRARAFRLSSQPWLDMLLMRSRGDALRDTMEPVIVAYIHGEVAKSSDQSEQLADLFGLTFKEAGLAIALSRGQTIREAAVQLGLTEQSAREYTKRIYGKTGTRGQADLVRLLLTSVAAMA